MVLVEPASLLKLDPNLDMLWAANIQSSAYSKDAYGDKISLLPDDRVVAVDNSKFMVLNKDTGVVEQAYSVPGYAVMINIVSERFSSSNMVVIICNSGSNNAL